MNKLATSFSQISRTVQNQGNRSSYIFREWLLKILLLIFLPIFRLALHFYEKNKSPKSIPNADICQDEDRVFPFYFCKYILRYIRKM
jgi:hypothetical protein